MATRPLSPHLSVYRFAYTMALSVLHRATGIVLAFGLLLLVGWLLALAAGSQQYADFSAFAATWPLKVVIGGLLVSFCYHLTNGIRHLFWDMGLGLERREARRSGRIVVVVTVLLAAALLYFFFGVQGGP